MKVKNKDYALEMNRGGELVQKTLHDYTKSKYKADTLFLGNAASYILMVLCVVIDVAFFRSLFVRISYDSPWMIWLETMGLAFAADIVAVYAGILAKRLKQRLSRDKLNLVLLLLVPITALIVNSVLRVSTMNLTTVDGTVDSAAIALTIIGIVTPIFTSIGNFAISFQVYDPLGQKMCRQEVLIAETRDLIRRLQAIKSECEDFDAEGLKEMDRRLLANAKKEVMNDALIRYAAVRVKLMEYLQDPTSTNVLSKSRCNEILERIIQELTALERACDENAVLETMDTMNNTEQQVVSFTEAA